MPTIIAAFGEHDHATPELLWAIELAKITGWPFEVVTICRPSTVIDDPATRDEIEADRRAGIATVLDGAGAPEAEVTVLVDDDPLDALAILLDEHPDVGLVVVGAGGEGDRRHRSVLGNPASQLLRESRVPVAVVRAHHPPLGEGLIVVGVDGSAANATAVTWADEVGGAAGGRLHAVFVYDPLDDTFVHKEGWHRHSDEVKDLVASVRSAPVELFMVPGHPVETLADHARQHRAAAIVVGTRGRGGFGGLRLGRVPSQLIDHAPCPLVVIPH